MKAGDPVTLVAIPANLHDDEELQTRTLFQRCVGRSFVIAAIESFDGVPFPLARLDVLQICSAALRGARDPPAIASKASDKAHFRVTIWVSR